MAKQATNQELATTPATSEPERQKTPEEQKAERRQATLRAQFETLAPGETDLTGMWFDVGRMLPNASRECMLGGRWSGSSLSGDIRRMVMQPNGIVRMHVEVTSGRLPVGSMNYVFFGPGAYSYTEAMPLTPAELGLVRR